MTLVMNNQKMKSYVKIKMTLTAPDVDAPTIAADVEHKYNLFILLMTYLLN